MVRMGACRVPDRGSIPRRGDFYMFEYTHYILKNAVKTIFDYLTKHLFLFLLVIFNI